MCGQEYLHYCWYSKSNTCPLKYLVRKIYRARAMDYLALMPQLLSAGWANEIKAALSLSNCF